MRKSYSLKLAAFTILFIVAITLICSYNLTVINASPKKELIVTRVALQINAIPGESKKNKNKEFVDFVIKTNGKYTPTKMVAKGTTFSVIVPYREENSFYGEKVVRKGKFKTNKIINITITLKNNKNGKKIIIKTEAPVYPSGLSK